MKPADYDPLGYCEDPKKRKRFSKLAASAKKGRLAAIVRLACLHCVDFEPAEVKRCTDPSCPLWIRATKGAELDSD